MPPATTTSPLEELLADTLSTDASAKKVKPARTAKAKKSASAGERSRAAVAKAMSAIETGTDLDEVEAVTVDASALAPVTRPNGQVYQPRPLGPRSDIDTLHAARTAGLPVMLAGRPGTGKTALIEAAFGDEAITVAGHGDLEVSDLIGRYTQRPDGSYEWIDGPLPVAMRRGAVLFVDDATLIPPAVLARLYPAMDGRGIIHLTEHTDEAVTAADGFFVVAAHNPDVPGALLSEALQSRFLIHVEVATDLHLAETLGVPKKAVLAATALRAQRESGVIGWAPEMRELLAFARVAEALGVGVAAGNLIAQAPEDDREAVAEVVATWFASATVPMHLGDSQVSA